MRQMTRVSAFRPLLAALACGLCMSLAGGLTACKTVDIGEDTPQDSVPKDTATATLRITNNITLFSDSLDFLLFPGTTTEITTAAGGKAIGGVGVGKTGIFKVPAGTWKIAFTDQAKAMTAMRSLDTDEWVKAILDKDGDYSLILSSDGQNVRWVPTFTTNPSLK